MLLLKVCLTIKIGRLNIALVVVALEHNHVGWHELVAQNLDDLADFEVLPAIGLEDSLLNVRSQHLALVLFKVRLLALGVFKPILECRCDDDEP